MERFAIKRQTESSSLRERVGIGVVSQQPKLGQPGWWVCFGYSVRLAVPKMRWPPTFRVDPFIPAIEKMKFAVASLDCLALSGAESKILERMGTAFLVSGRRRLLNRCACV